MGTALLREPARGCCPAQAACGAAASEGAVWAAGSQPWGDTEGLQYTSSEPPAPPPRSLTAAPQRPPDSARAAAAQAPAGNSDRISRQSSTRVPAPSALCARAAEGAGRGPRSKSRLFCPKS